MREEVECRDDLLLMLNLWRVCLDGVVDVDKDEKDCDEEGHPARYDLRVDKETEIQGGLSISQEGSSSQV